MITSSLPSAASTTPAISRETRSASLRQRPQLRVLVGEQPAIGPGAQGDEAHNSEELRSLPDSATYRFTCGHAGRRQPADDLLSRSYLDLCTPICIMTWGDTVQERVAFWLHELPGQEMIYHHVSLPVVFWLHLRTVQRHLRSSDPVFGRHADVTWV